MNGVKRPLFVIPLMLALGLTSCAGTTPLVDTPRVTLVGVEMTSLSFRSQTFLLKFHVDNPNHMSLPIESLRYQVRLGEHRFASGKSRGGFVVPPDGEYAFAISVDLNILQQTSLVTSLLQTTMREDVEYELQGSLVVDIPYARPLQFSNSGVVSISSL